MDELGIVEVGDVEDRNLQLLEEASLLVGAPADADEVVLVERLEVFRVAGDFELAFDRRVLGVAQVDGEQRVDLAERDHKRAIAHESHGLDDFAGRQAADLPDDVEPLAGLPRTNSCWPWFQSPLVTTRRWPSCSSTANWLRSVPSTRPRAASCTSCDSASKPNFQMLGRGLP